MTDTYKIKLGANGGQDIVFTKQAVGESEFTSNVTLNSDADGVLTLQNSEGSDVRITGLADPTDDEDAATKSYVDSVASGLAVKDSVIAASTGENISITGLSAGPIIDGVTISNGKRCLLKDQTSGSENGIYTYDSESEELVRATDFDNTADISAGAFCFVQEGTINSDKGFVLTTNNDITVGSTSLTFSQFSSAGTISAGDGLSKSGDTLSVEVDDLTLEIDSSDGLQIKNDGVTRAKIDDSTAEGGESDTGLLATDPGLSFSNTDGLALDFFTLDEAEAVNVAADSFALIDAESSNLTKKVKIDELVEAMAGEGLSDSSGVLSVSFDDFSEGEISVANDSIAFIDANDGDTTKKESVADFVEAMAGTGGGLTASSGVLSVEVDDDTLDFTTEGKLQIKDAGITGDHLNASISISTTGTIEAGEITCSSDARLKTDIHTITNGLDIVNSLRAVTWKWKPELHMGDYKLAGVVAQEAQQTKIGHAIRGTKDHLRVDYNSLTGYLISAVQGLTQQVEDLKAQLS